LTGDPGLAGPCVLHKLGVPTQELGYRSHKDNIAQCIRSLHPALNDGAFREKPVIVGSGPNDLCIHCGSTPANPVKIVTQAMGLIGVTFGVLAPRVVVYACSPD
jgi:hypothetical protein